MDKNMTYDLRNTLCLGFPDYEKIWDKILLTQPEKGVAGISGITRIYGKGLFSLCITYRDDTGNLIGFFEYFPVEGFVDIKKGDFSITVDPKRFREGVGSKLLQEAMNRIEINLEQQYYTPLGYKLVRSYLDRNGCRYIEDSYISMCYSD
jgi:GNAT superfamily N-acetyltransferase